MTFTNLDSGTRKHMQDEVEKDIREGNLYFARGSASRDSGNSLHCFGPLLLRATTIRLPILCVDLEF